MKLQLTKTKTIEIGFGGKGDKKSSSADMTGVELFAGDERGCPTVRLVRRKGVWRLLAAGFVSPPQGELPEKWEDMPKQPKWELPTAFQSPHAAIVVNSPQSIFTQATAETILNSISLGLNAPTAEKNQSAEKKRIGIRRSASTEPAAKPAQSGKAPEFPKPGIPVSENGMRFAVKPVAEQGFHLEAALPEFQALWLSRLLPEGRRPTASSIQLHDAALMASVLAQPEFIQGKGNALAVFVGAHDIHFAGYKAGMPVLWRKCPVPGGTIALREAVKRGLGVDDTLVDSVLDDSLVDPRSALEPILHPVLDELELSRAYLVDQHAVRPDRILLMGLSAGAAYWCKYAQESHRLELAAPGVFDGIEFPVKPKPGDIDETVQTGGDAPFLPALGAALAAAEAEE